MLFREGVEVSSLRYRLGSNKDHTVFEGEGVAGGSLGMRLLLDEVEVRGPVSMYVDSQRALRATASHKPAPSHYLFDWWHRHADLLGQKHPDVDLMLRWTPGHEGVELRRQRARRRGGETRRTGRVLPIGGIAAGATGTPALQQVRCMAGVYGTLQAPRQGTVGGVTALRAAPTVRQQTPLEGVHALYGGSATTTCGHPYPATHQALHT
jgi:hypothetical protein